MNLSDTYFGYTDNMKPMLKAKTENTLNNMIRDDNGKVTTEKEWVYNKLTKGYAPAIEENYQYWSRKTGELTKPKTLYNLKTIDGSSYEVNKTLYDYAYYIVSNGFLDAEKAMAYITAEDQANTAKAQTEADKLAAEKTEREAQKQQQEKERQERKIKLEQKRTEIKNNFTESQIERITEAANYCMENYDMFRYSQYNSIPESERLEYMYGQCERMITEDHLYGEYVIEFMKRFKKEIESGQEIAERDNMSYNIRRIFFGVDYNMSPQAIRSILNGQITAEEAYNRQAKLEQQKQSQADKMKTFYRYVVGTGFTEALGEQIQINDITVYGMDYQGSYILIEESSGCQMTKGRNKSEAKANMLEAVQKLGIEKVKSVITERVKSNGLSPILQNAI